MKFILVSLILTPLIYFAIAFILVSLPFSREQPDKSLDFNVLNIEAIAEIVADEQYYKARDGSDIFYRYLKGESNLIVVLVHGSGTEGRYLLPLAEKLNASLNVSVVIPDLRGHGKSALEKLGDVDYLDQLQHDLQDLQKELVSNFPGSKVVLGGHSSGGGLVIKVGGNEVGLFDGYILLAPYLAYNAPTVRPNSGGWVQVRQARYAGLAMLNNVKLKFLNHLPVLYFNRPEAVNNELQVDNYSYRMNQSFSPQSYSAELKANKGHILALVGENDEAFYADKFEQVFSETAPQTELNIIHGVKHLDLPSSQVAIDLILAWLEKKYNLSNS